MTCGGVKIMSLEIRGADQLAKLAKDLRSAGEKDLSKELNQSIREAVEPAKINIRAAARRDLPHRGGFSRKVASMRFTARVSSRNGLRLTASHRYQLKLIDQGSVRHPLFGDRDHWYITRFRSGIFTNAWEENAPETRNKVNEAAQRVADKIGR
jgi:hypothetical protein